LSIVFWLAAAIAGAQDPLDCPDGAPASLRSGLSAEVDSMLAPWNRPGRPGAAVLVIQCGQVLHKKGYGLADVALQRSTAPDTLFELGSITKPFTALAIMMLVERRQLRYDQSLKEVSQTSRPGRDTSPCGTF
jgi:CubicO group peptidase (beta-lactamase class C family)